MTDEPLELEVPSRYNTTRIGNWMRLLRVPNLLTVPGDPIAGFLLVAPQAAWNTHHVWVAITAALCLYAGGILLNDVVDVAHDRNKRPWRPLPFGLIAIRHANAVLVFFLIAGLTLCLLNGMDSFFVGGCLGVALCAYNFELKHSPVLGALGLGFCRGLSVWLGTFAAPGNPPMNDACWNAAAAVVAYVVGLSLYAKFERRHKVPAWAAVAPLAGAGVAVVVFATQLWTPTSGVRFIALLFLLTALLAYPALLLIRHLRARRMDEDSSDLRVAGVGGLLRGLLLLQAALVLGSGGGPLQATLVIVLLSAWPLHAYIEKTFYST